MLEHTYEHAGAADGRRMAGGDDLDVVMAAVMAALGRLPGDAAEAPDAVLVSRMQGLVRLKAMVEAALCEQLAAFDARAGARYDGQTSTRAWLRARLRIDGQAGALLVVARQLGGLPLVGKAFAAGEIGLEHAAVVAQLVSQVGVEAVAGYESILLDLARRVPPGKLRIACGHLRQLLDAAGDADEAGARWRRRYLSAARTVDGAVHVQGLLDAASGEVVLAALGAAMPVPAEHDDRSPGQRRVDALVDVCAGWLSAGKAPASGGVRPQVQVTVSLAALQAQLPQAGPLPASQTGRLGDLPGDVPVLACGQPITAGQARRIACDAAIVPVVLGSGSEPLDIGRATRIVPTGIRRALQVRDGGCRFPGCDRPASWTDAHHLKHWADGGPTNLNNLILLCRHHHTLLHQGWQARGHPAGTIRFQRPDRTHLDITSPPHTRPPTRGP